MKENIKFCLISLSIFFVTAITSFSQFNQYTNRSLFSDFKAIREGDAIMVLIVEDTQADNSATSNEGRSTELSGGVDVSASNAGFKGQASLNTGTNFRASGQTTRKEVIRSKLSARVIEVEDNGNLRIEGTRTTKINGETQKIIIRGIVRPVDVLPNNSVYSYSILDLTLLIDGDGSVTKVQEPGLITKFLRFLF